MHHLVSAAQGPIAFRFLNSVAAVPDIISNLQRRVATDIFKNSGSLLTTLFLTAKVKVCPLYPSGAGDQVFSATTTVTFQFPSTFGSLLYNLLHCTTLFSIR